jgi:hypothetical protein
VAVLWDWPPGRCPGVFGWHRARAVIQPAVDGGVGGPKLCRNACSALRAADRSTVRRGLKTLDLRPKFLSMKEAVRSHGCFKL